MMIDGIVASSQPEEMHSNIALDAAGVWQSLLQVHSAVQHLRTATL